MTQDVTTLLGLRTERGLTLAQCAVELGLSASSASWLSEIENGKKPASLRLALRIERWSEGRVSGASVCPELSGHVASKPSEAASVAPPSSAGAGAKSGALQ